MAVGSLVPTMSITVGLGEGSTNSFQGGAYLWYDVRLEKTVQYKF